MQSCCTGYTGTSTCKNVLVAKTKSFSAVIMPFGTKVVHLGGTTGSALDSRSEGRGFDSH